VSKLYYLNNAGKTDLDNSLAHYSRSGAIGTALYYGVHKALANLKADEARFSNETVHSVNVITFTDGLELGTSAGLSNSSPIAGKSGLGVAAYAEYIKTQIGERTIGGTSIDAYSIGVKGSDVSDDTAFNTTLSNLASDDVKNVHQLTNTSALTTTLNTIATSLDVNIKRNFRMVTTQGETGALIRMTFDGAALADANASTSYIEGKLAYSGGKYSLADITASSGITFDNDTAIEGALIGASTVSFAFNNIEGCDLQPAKIKQWIKLPDAAAWQGNSEYVATDSTEIDMDTMLVYLVLDASSSLDASQIGDIRDAVKAFITALYNRANP
jgi:hypothetical protein